MDRDMRGSPISVGQRDLTRDRDSHGARAPYTGQGHPWDTGTGAGTPHGTGTRTRMGQRHPLVKLTPRRDRDTGTGQSPRRTRTPKEKESPQGTAHETRHRKKHDTTRTPRDRGHDIPFSDTRKRHSIPLGTQPPIHGTQGTRYPLLRHPQGTQHPPGDASHPQDTIVPTGHHCPQGTPATPRRSPHHHQCSQIPPAPFIPHGWSRFGPAGVAGSAQGRSAGR